MIRSPCSWHFPLSPGDEREWPCGNRARFLRGRSRTPQSQRTPHQVCWAAQELFGWWCCRKVESPRAPLFPRHPTTSFRAYRGTIELVSNATRMASMRRNKKRLLRIFSGFFFRTCRILPTQAGYTFGGAKLRWRFPRQSLEHAIELRQRLKSHSECNLADPYVAVTQ